MNNIPGFNTRPLVPAVRPNQANVKQPVQQNEVSDDSLKKDEISHSVSDLNNSGSSVFAEAYQQKYPRSCGAACLFFIARNWGLQTTPILAETLKKFPALANTYPYFDDKNKVHYCYESDIYMIVSGFQGDKSDLMSANTASPAKIFLTAKLLGLTPKVYWAYDKNITPQMLRDPIVREITEDLKATTTVNLDVLPPLAMDEIAMKLCIWADVLPENKIGINFGKWNDTCHWVACRPDGTFMDPALGKNFNSFSEFATGSEKALVNLGVSIVLKNKTVNPHQLFTVGID